MAFDTFLNRRVAFCRRQKISATTSYLDAEVPENPVCFRRSPDVNVAAGQQGQFKEEDFSRDSGEDRDRLLDEFRKIYDFCLSINANCFLVEKDIAGVQTQSIDELVDLKLLHRARSRVTVRDRKGRLYDAYMLDLSRYTGERARRNFELVKFWGKDAEDTLRRASLIFLEREL
ncbi:hypothetical protein [Bradyrhizobium elkanii]|uniref:hypothetical protein n=1 Tax=Bradyrhizobium elkanii TaxID=29448 RepID=UPI003D20BEFD